MSIIQYESVTVKGWKFAQCLILKNRHTVCVITNQSFHFPFNFLIKKLKHLHSITSVFVFLLCRE